MTARTKRGASGMRLALASAAVAGVALLPLYGDPRPSPVTQPDWARMILRALDLIDNTSLSEQASQVFATLSWKNSLSYPAERYSRGTGVAVETTTTGRLVRASAAVGEVEYPLAVARGGDYRVRLLLAGDGRTPAEAEIRASQEGKPQKVFSVPATPNPEWADAGSVHLDPGSYTASVLLPRGGSLEFVELAPPCLSPIEPIGGWKATALATIGDVAVTALKAVDLEHELPPSDAALEIAARDIRPEGAIVTEASYGPVPGLTGLWLKAGAKGLEASVFVDLPEAGLWSISVFGLVGGGQRWTADACRKSVLCAESSPAAGPHWRQVVSGEFAAGRHFFTVTLGRDAAIQRVRLERKKDAAADYVATLRRLGLDLGPEGPITRDKAVEAMRFIRSRKALDADRFCRDLIDGEPRLGTTVVDTGTPPQPTGPGTPTGPGVRPPDPLGPPLLPPQQVASPIVP
jgi:hypothetical protein